MSNSILDTINVLSEINFSPKELYEKLCEYNHNYAIIYRIIYLESCKSGGSGNNKDEINKVNLKYENKFNSLELSDECENALEFLMYESNSYAFHYLGTMCLFGYHSYPKDYKRAKELYDKAIELGNIDVSNELGIMYYYGRGVEQDYKRAKELFEKAIEFGNRKAISNLGFMYHGGYGVEIDYGKSIELYKSAIEFGNSSTMYNLGYIYYYGNGVEINYAKAAELFEKAIEFGNRKALYYLATMYYYGRGVRQSYDKAKELFDNAAELCDNVMDMHLESDDKDSIYQFINSIDDSDMIGRLIAHAIYSNNEEAVKILFRKIID